MAVAGYRTRCFYCGFCTICMLNGLNLHGQCKYCEQPSVDMWIIPLSFFFRGVWRGEIRLLGSVKHWNLRGYVT